jgi:hypothetical protein
MRVSWPSGSWVTIDAELSQNVPQTMRVTKSMLTVFFNLKKSARVKVSAQDTSFTAACFVENVFILLADRHAPSQATSPAGDCICISTIPSPILPGMSKKRWPAVGASVFPTPIFTRLGHGRLPLVRAVKEAILRRTMDSRPDVLAIVTEIPSELSQEQVKSAFLHWKGR